MPDPTPAPEKPTPLDFTVAVSSGDFPLMLAANHEGDATVAFLVEDLTVRQIGETRGRLVRQIQRSEHVTATARKTLALISDALRARTDA